MTTTVKSWTMTLRLGLLAMAAMLLGACPHPDLDIPKPSPPCTPSTARPLFSSAAWSAPAPTKETLANVSTALRVDVNAALAAPTFGPQACYDRCWRKRTATWDRVAGQIADVAATARITAIVGAAGVVQGDVQALNDEKRRTDSAMLRKDLDDLVAAANGQR